MTNDNTFGRSPPQGYNPVIPVVVTSLIADRIKTVRNGKAAQRGSLRHKRDNMRKDKLRQRK